MEVDVKEVGLNLCIRKDTRRGVGSTELELARVIRHENLSCIHQLTLNLKLLFFPTRINGTNLKQLSLSQKTAMAYKLHIFCSYIWQRFTN
jgi:hypothetical protein